MQPKCPVLGIGDRVEVLGDDLLSPWQSVAPTHRPTMPKAS